MLLPIYNVDVVLCCGPIIVALNFNYVVDLNFCPFIMLLFYDLDVI